MLVAAPVVRDLVAVVFDPDAVAIPAQLDAPLDERLGRAVNAAAELQIAVGGDPRRAAPGRVETAGRQRPQLLALVFEPVGDDVAASRVLARQRDPVAPGRVDVIELGQLREAPRRPEPGLQVADRALDRALLAWRLGRAGVRVKGEVAAQLREARVQ